MVLSMTYQAINFLIIVMLGIILGFFYDIFRTIRRIIHHNNIILQLQDFFYWILAALLVFFVLLHIDSGQIRSYSIIGLILGGIIYFAAFSTYILKFALVVAYYIQNAVKYIFNLFIIPIKWIFGLIFVPIKFIFVIIKNALNKAKGYAIIKQKDIKRRAKKWKIKHKLKPKPKLKPKLKQQL